MLDTRARSIHSGGVKRSMSHSLVAPRVRTDFGASQLCGWIAPRGGELPVMTAACRRRANLRKARSVGTHTRHEKAALREFMGDVCPRCRVPESDRHPYGIQWDHIIPISFSWLLPCDSIVNIQPLCGRCNASKSAHGDMTDHRPHGWAQYVVERAPGIAATHAAWVRARRAYGGRVSHGKAF